MADEKYFRSKQVYQRDRCMKCNTRINVELGQKEVRCPNCQVGWVVFWVTPDLPMVLRRISPAYWPKRV